MDLDELLDASAPPTARRTPEVVFELRALVVAAEAAKPRRQRRRVLIAGGVIAAVLAGTGAATYAMDGQRVIPWTTPSRHACTMEFAVGPAGPDGLGGEPDMWPKHIDKARRSREVALAQGFLARFDYASVDQRRAIATWQAIENRTIASETAHPVSKPGEPTDPPQPRQAGDALAITAVGNIVWQRMDDYLAAHGFDMSAAKGSDLYLLVTSQGWSCDGGPSNGIENLG